MSRDLRITLAGCGRWGRNILRDLVTLGCQVGVIDPSAEARQAAATLGATAVSDRLPPDWAEDGCIVATPASMHAATIDSLAGRGVPLFVEKPLTTDPRSAERIALSLAGRLFVMHKWRYHPAIEMLAAMAREGSLGALRGLRTVRTQGEIHQTDVDAIWTLAPHDLTIAIEIAGRVPSPIRFAVAEGTHPSGGMIAAMGHSPWMVMEVSASRAERVRQVDLFFERGTVRWRDEEEAIAVRQDGGREDRPVPPSDPPLLRQLSAFLTFLRGGPPPKSDAAEGAAVVSTIARLRQLAGIDQRAD